MRRLQRFARRCCALIGGLAAGGDAVAAPTDPFQSYQSTFTVRAAGSDNRRAWSSITQTATPRLRALRDRSTSSIRAGNPVDFSAAGSPQISPRWACDQLIVDNSGGPTQGNIYVFGVDSSGPDRGGASRTPDGLNGPGSSVDRSSKNLRYGCGGGCIAPNGNLLGIGRLQQRRMLRRRIHAARDLRSGKGIQLGHQSAAATASRSLDSQRVRRWNGPGYGTPQPAQVRPGRQLRPSSGRPASCREPARCTRSRSIPATDDLYSSTTEVGSPATNRRRTDFVGSARHEASSAAKPSVPTRTSTTSANDFAFDGTGETLYAGRRHPDLASTTANRPSPRGAWRR